MEIYMTPGIGCGDFWRTREGAKRDSNFEHLHYNE